MTHTSIEAPAASPLALSQRSAARTDPEITSRPSRRTLWALAIVSAVAMSACGQGALVGQWTSASMVGGATLETTLSLDADGTASYALIGSGMCTGTLTIAGLTWSSSPSSIAFGGHPACTGLVTCTISGTAVNLDCATSGSMGPQNGTCETTLSADENTLTIANCVGTMGGSTTYTRAAH